MSAPIPDPEDTRSEFERRTQAVLDESVARLDGHTRSRLNQARRRALEAHAARAQSPFARLFGDHSLFAPAGALAVVGVLAVLLWTVRPGGDTTAIEDLELLADHDALELARGGELEFYEWALAVADADLDVEALGT